MASSIHSFVEPFMSGGNKRWRPLAVDRFDVCDLLDPDGSACLFDHWTLDTHHVNAVEVTLIALLGSATTSLNHEDAVRALVDAGMADTRTIEEALSLQELVKTALDRLGERGLITADPG